MCHARMHAAEPVGKSVPTRKPLDVVGMWLRFFDLIIDPEEHLVNAGLSVAV